MKLSTLIRWHRQQAFLAGQEYSLEGWTKSVARDKLQRVRIHNQTANALETLDEMQRASCIKTEGNIFIQSNEPHSRKT